MAYTKNTWQTGDVVTAAKLNGMEGGIENVTPLVVGLSIEAPGSAERPCLTETWKTIHDACENGQEVLIQGIFTNDDYESINRSYVHSIIATTGAFSVNDSEGKEYRANDINGYPVLYDPDDPGGPIS